MQKQIDVHDDDVMVFCFSKAREFLQKGLHVPLSTIAFAFEVIACYTPAGIRGAAGWPSAAGDAGVRAAPGRAAGVIAHTRAAAEEHAARRAAAG